VKSSLLIFVRKNWIHLLIWALMILFVFFAPGIIDRTTLKYGKPIQVEPGALNTSDLAKGYVDNLQPIKYKGNYVYYITGWGFAAIDPKFSVDDYTRYLVLQSDSRTYYYSVESAERGDVRDAFPQLQLKSTNLGFNVIIAKQFIEPGKYRLGIIFRQNGTGTEYITWTPQTIVRTKNQISLGN